LNFRILVADGIRQSIDFSIANSSSRQTAPTVGGNQHSVPLPRFANRVLPLRVSIRIEIENFGRVVNGAR